ncbi:MAG: hypothetical protein L0Y80_01380 [Ignavibacteriae bacterium]|nr:hypothetical protein [Ignavibacteriota bacterium]
MKKFIVTLEWVFRHLIVYPFFRVVFHNKYSDATLDIKSLKKILVLRFDRIGDMIVTTPIFATLKRRNPELHIAVFTSLANAEIIRNNTNVDKIYTLGLNWWRLWKEVLKARKEGYDIVLNFIFNRTTSAGILANLAAPNGFKVGQGAEKYKFYFNRLLRLDRTELHMVEVLAYYVESVFGFKIDRKELQFEIFVDEESRNKVDLFLGKHQLARRSALATELTQYVVLNISATDSVRKIQREQVIFLVKHLTMRKHYPVVMIASPAEREVLISIVHQLKLERCLLYPEQGDATLLEIASLVEGAVCVFTPDTSIIHFASATKTPVMGFFTPLQMAHEWVPYYVQNAAVYAPPGKPVSGIPLDEMAAQADRFLATLGTPAKEYAR